MEATTLPPNIRWSFTSDPPSRRFDSRQGGDNRNLRQWHWWSGYHDRKGKALTLKVSSKSAKIESIEWKDKSAFDYTATKKLEDGQASISLEKSFRLRLAAAYQTQQSLYNAGAAHYPLAGESTKSSIKNLKINGQAVDEVKEYVDADGHTWYLWYFKNLKLNEDENVVSFE